MFPLSNWTEGDVLDYIARERIDVVPLYFAAPRPVVQRDGMLIMRDDARMPLRPGETVEMRSIRFRSPGARPRCDAPGRQAVGGGLAKARESAARVAAQFGVRTIDRKQLDTFRSDSAARTVSPFAIRTVEEFEAGHLPSALSAPGGQLAQATDCYFGVREARIVLLDEADLVRASNTASWLFQLGLGDVCIYAAIAAERTETGRVEKRILGNLNEGKTVQPADLPLLIASGVILLDLEVAPPYFRERLYIPGSIVARRSTLSRKPDKVPGTGPIVLTSADGALARLAAADLLWHGKRQVLRWPAGRLAGSRRGWGGPGHGLDQPTLDPSEALPQLPTLEQRRVTLAA